jgi:hypothetical protein
MQYNVTRIFIGYREPSNLQLTCLKECYIPTPNAIVFKKIWLTQIFPTMNLTLTTYLGDNCIVFENFTASIGDLMVANQVYCPF